MNISKHRQPTSCDAKHGDCGTTTLDWKDLRSLGYHRCDEPPKKEESQSHNPHNKSLPDSEERFACIGNALSHSAMGEAPTDRYRDADQKPCTPYCRSSALTYRFLRDLRAIQMARNKLRKPLESGSYWPKKSNPNCSRASSHLSARLFEQTQPDTPGSKPLHPYGVGRFP